MSDNEERDIKPFEIERAKQGRAKCKKCKESCEAGKLRLAKLNPNNPFGSGPLKQWYHIDCFLLLKNSKTSKTLSSSDDIEGWENISVEDRKEIVAELGDDFREVAETSAKKDPKASSGKDDSFTQFQKIICKIADEPSYKSKSLILQRFLKEGTSKTFQGNLEIWLRLLATKDADKRVYNLQSKQIAKLFSKLFNCSHSEMLDDLEGGDVSETVAKFFKKSGKIKPAKESTLSIIQIDQFLDDLSELTQEEQQVEFFEGICAKCTADDLKTLIRLIKHDLKMNCGTRHILDAVHPDAYGSFQKSRDLNGIIKEYSSSSASKSKSSKPSGMQVMTAISPMLAEPCKDFDKAIKKCPEGFFSEIKYDGERVQIHKQGNEFKFYSRNLKPVLDHKIAKLKEYLPKAFPHGDDLIVDSEILMVDALTGDLLPFGTLGKHKKEECGTSVTCLFIFDCLLFNGADLTKKPMKERRQFLEDNLTVIKNHIQLSEYRLLKTKNDLVEMTKEVLKKGLEGLVLKGSNSIYEPGKRRWLKVKKDYLLKGAIADTADLVILGAWFGTGKMGGQYSIFLMGCYDEKTEVWKTVTKVHSGLDDNEMEKMHKKLSPMMEKCDGKIPKWISLNRAMIPNALAKAEYLDAMPVLEITGAEFTKSDTHTANSISIRFPRITKVRSDKSPKQATTQKELNHLYNESKAGVNIDELNKLKTCDVEDSKERITTSLASSSKSGKPKIKSEDSESCETPSKRPKIVKELTDNVDLLFKGFKLFQSAEINEKYRDELRKFEKLGGCVTSNSTSANIVLHESDEITADPEALRKLYNPICKHYQVAWLKDSLKEMKLKNPVRYFVKLHQI